MFGRSLARFRPVAHLIRRKFSSDAGEMDKILSGFSPEVRKTLRDRLNEMEKDAYNQAMPAQLNELAANTTPLLQRANLKPAPPPSRSHLRRDTTKARAMTQGLKVPAARQMADRLYEFAAEMIDRLYTPAGAEFNRFIAGKTKSTPAPSGFWEAMEQRKTELTNRGAGHSNAFEEQIEWTEQGKMWPYPIDNEYLMGEEADVSFTDHIFLDKYVAEKHTHLPKSGPVAHFMELVCVGLSKNPYMTVRKKRDHLDAFAAYFSPEHIEKIHRLHEEAERQAAVA
ncbi:28S ribosomal protein S31, mitochondrial [Aphelenchoides fujianensis]|nr:28S ribosomal protein S31, mitochondrial [Aphelenchoides fujianensis]